MFFVASKTILWLFTLFFLLQKYGEVIDLAFKSRVI